jgi:hypothetical protein
MTINHQCAYCDSHFVEVIDLIAHIKEVHKK